MRAAWAPELTLAIGTRQLPPRPPDGALDGTTHVLPSSRKSALEGSEFVAFLSPLARTMPTSSAGSRCRWRSSGPSFRNYTTSGSNARFGPAWAPRFLRRLQGARPWRRCGWCMAPQESADTAVSDGWGLGGVSQRRGLMPGALVRGSMGGMPGWSWVARWLRLPQSSRTAGGRLASTSSGQGSRSCTVGRTRPGGRTSRSSRAPGCRCWGRWRGTAPG